MSEARWSDRRLVLWMSATIVVLILAISVLAPSDASDDPRPSTYNTGPNGAEAAYLMLHAIGRESSRWDRSIEQLNAVDASRTTLVLAAPVYAPGQKDAIAAAVKAFLQRGGRVLTTGPTGALLLPDGSVGPPTVFMSGDCRTSPGDGPLAAAGSMPLADRGAWAGKARVEIAQRCGRDAVVVRMIVGRGEAVWWSSASPMTNASLTNDGDLRLLLLSVGESRAVLWDEAVQEETTGMWAAMSGLPRWWLIGQFALIAVLLVLSFSRRNGPIRDPAMLPRSSPVEFANSMGDLYEKAGANAAAVEAARRRLQRAIVRDAGVPQAAMQDHSSDSGSLVAALNERLGGEWKDVGDHLARADEALREELSNRDALALTRTLSEDAERVRAAARGRRRAQVPARAA